MEKDEILATNQAFFREYAPRYDVGRNSMYTNEMRRVEGDLSLVGPREKLAQMTVVDIGCGTGFYSSIIAGFGAKTLHCVDLNQDFLQAAKLNIEMVSGDAEVTCHEADMETFIQTEPGTLASADLIVMGSVLQYMSNYLELLRQLVGACPSACFYITSTPMHRGGRIEQLLAVADYGTHKVISSEERSEKSSQPLITVPTDIHDCEAIFHEAGFKVHSYRYRTFHTAWANLLYRLVHAVVPSWGSRFTIIALAAEA
jgi:2-polyprenyl-3-methyl-5-hydroxy-6-metoxy-1,4-benzoquinol methylase